MKAIASILVLFCHLAAFSSQLFLHLENDCFLPGKSLGKGDHDYTHGTCIEYIDNSFFHWKIGQNMYAPSDLKQKDHIPGDRPYAGILYGGIGYEFFRDYDPNWTHYGELDFDMIGPAAFAGHAQKFIHKILNYKDPQGQHHQLHNAFVVNGQWWEKYNWYLCDYVAIVPRIGILAGTIQDAVEVGCYLKVGWNLKNDVGSSIMFSAVQEKGHSWLDDLQAYAYIGADKRYYLYNNFLEGSFIRSKDRDQHLDVDIEPFVGEIQSGICIQYKSLVVKYYMIVRQDEFKHQKHSLSLEYGGLSIDQSRQHFT